MEETDLMRQIREAFHTVTLDDRFRTDPGRQAKLLAGLQALLNEDAAKADRLLDEGAQEVKRLTEERNRKRHH